MTSVFTNLFCKKFLTKPLWQVGNNLSVPKEIKVVDASGKLVIPGGIDPHTHLQLSFGGMWVSKKKRCWFNDVNYCGYSIAIQECTVAFRKHRLYTEKVIRLYLAPSLGIWKCGICKMFSYTVTGATSAYPFIDHSTPFPKK